MDEIPTWVLKLSALAGLAGLKGLQGKWTDKVQTFLQRMATSMFAGVLTYFVCVAMSLSPAWTIPLVGIGSYMGLEALKSLEGVWKKRIAGQDSDNSKESGN